MPEPPGTTVRRPTFVDLFAGAGGLSLGLAAAGFRGRLAVESSTMAAETYFRNFHDRSPAAWADHLRLGLKEQISAGFAVATSRDVLAHREDLRSLLGEGQVDLVAGGPPCQGFSTAGKRDQADPRNALPFEFLEFVEVLLPRAVLIENVAGLRFGFSGSNMSPAFLIEEKLRRIGPGYVTQLVELNARFYGVAQDRPRVMILALREDVAPGSGVDVDLLTRTRPGTVVRDSLFTPITEFPVTVESVLGDLGNRGYLYARAVEYPGHLQAARHLRFSTKLRPPALREGNASGGPPNHELRTHSSLVRQRFRLLHALARYGLDGAVLQMPARLEWELAEQQLRAILQAQEPQIQYPMVFRRKVALSEAGLISALRRYSSKKHSQHVLRGADVAPTIMSLPDDHVHYREPRTLSVREMARLQSFPDAFVFYGKVTTGGQSRRFEVPQYTQVGNAVPPKLARAVGSRLATLLTRTEAGTLDETVGRGAVA